MTAKFTRVKEDFVCEHCQYAVEGNGYTNHCPACLWSKHVDVNPGDRAATCSSLMKPQDFELRGEERRITHRCVTCGHTKSNKTSPEDNFELLLKLSNHSLKN